MAFRHYPARKPFSHWNAHAQFDLFFQTLGGPRHEFVAFSSQQQDGNRVYIQNLADPIERRRKQIIQRQMGERRVSHFLQGRQALFSLLAPGDVSRDAGKKALAVLVKLAEG